MKILLLLTLGLALCSAAPQGNDARPRMRGPRRFPLATPGLQSVNRAAEAASIAEEPVEEVSPTRGASRGTSLPRRGRPTLRPKASIQVEDLETPASVRRADFVSGRSGLQLRRPKSRTTTTTTSAPPAVEEERSEMPEEMQKEEVIVMDEKMEKPIVSENKMMEQIEETIPIAEKEMPEEIKETMVKEAPTVEASKPKLRPIPIKLGRRGQGAQPTQQLTANKPESTQSDVLPQRHRFNVASDSGGALRVRSRGRESEIPAKQSKTQVEEASPAAERAPRVRRPTPPKQSTRVSPSRRTLPAEETVAEEQEVTETEHSLSFPEAVQKSVDNDMQGQTEAVSRTTVPEIDSPQDTTTSRTEELISFDEYDHLAPQLDILPKEVPKSELSDTSIKDIDVHYKENEGVLPSHIKEIESEIETEMAPQQDEVAISNHQKLETNFSPVVITTQKHELHQSPKFEEGLTILQRPRSEVNPRRSKNNFRDSDIIFRGGEPQVTLIGTLEDTPANELRVILSGLGSRRRGLGRPLTSPQKVTTSAPRAAMKKLSSEKIIEEDLNYDYYADLYEEEPIRKLK